MSNADKASFLPDDLIIVEKCSVFNLRKHSLYLVDEALDAKIRVLVEGKEMNAIENIQNVAMFQVQRQQILKRIFKGMLFEILHAVCFLKVFKPIKQKCY